MTFPELGTVVEITWLDSGSEYFDTTLSSEQLKLFTVATIGRLVRIDKELVVLQLAYDITKGEETEERKFVVIGIKSIKEIVEYVKKAV